MEHFQWIFKVSSIKNSQRNRTGVGRDDSSEIASSETSEKRRLQMTDWGKGWEDGLSSCIAAGPVISNVFMAPHAQLSVEKMRALCR